MGFLKRYSFLAGLAIIVSLFTIAVDDGDPRTLTFACVISALVLVAVVIFFEEEDD